MPEHLHKRKHLTSFQLIILGFAGVILIGALILTLPVSSASGVVTPFDQALFTSTSAVCVTGLVVQDTGSYWSIFGQAVILALIQIGGLGVVTVAVSVFMLSGRKISLMQRSTMQDAISAPKVGGIVRLTKFILRGTFLIEALGAVLLFPVFCIHIPLMKEKRELIQKGIFYRLKSPFEGNETAWMIVSEDQKKALVGYYRVMQPVNVGFKRLKL